MIGSDEPPASVSGKAPPVAAELKTILSVDPSNAVNGIVPPPLLPEDVNVILSALASVVSVIPVPATRVKVSVVASATTFDCPATANVEKAFAAPPVAAIVTVSVESFVVRVIFAPA